jgi:hypothetical protein
VEQEGDGHPRSGAESPGTARRISRSVPRYSLAMRCLFSLLAAWECFSLRPCSVARGLRGIKGDCEGLHPL